MAAASHPPAAPGERRRVVGYMGGCLGGCDELSSPPARIDRGLRETFMRLNVKWSSLFAALARLLVTFSRVPCRFGQKEEKKRKSRKKVHPSPTVPVIMFDLLFPEFIWFVV